MTIYKCDKCGEEVTYVNRYFVHVNNNFDESIFFDTGERLLCKNCANELYFWFKFNIDNH